MYAFFPIHVILTFLCLGARHFPEVVIYLVYFKANENDENW